MSKIKLLIDLVESIRSTADCLESIAKAMDGDDRSPEETKTTQQQEPAKVTAVTHEKIRELAVKLSRKGKREEIKRLIEQYGVKNVTAIADDDLESFYSELAAMEAQ